MTDFPTEPYEIMLATKRAAEVRIRADFQRKWGSFLKCDKCGGSVLMDSPGFSNEPATAWDGVYWHGDHGSGVCGGTYRTTGYGAAPC